MMISEKIAIAEHNHILPQHRNTIGQRFHTNLLRRDARNRKVDERKADTEALGDIEAELQEESDARRKSMAYTQLLKEKRKALNVAGIKQRRGGKAAKGKGYLPDPDSDESEFPNPVTDLANSESQHHDITDFDTTIAPLPAETSLKPLQDNLEAVVSVMTEELDIVVGNQDAPNVPLGRGCRRKLVSTRYSGWVDSDKLE
jgi:hypothetical protein